MAFFAQSGRLDPAALEAEPAIDQSQLFEGNSVLRGQAPGSPARRAGSRATDGARRLRARSDRTRAPDVVLNVVGLTGELVGEATPNLAALAREGASRPLRTILPAVTCSVQSTLITGLLPRDHGVVANGWYFRDLAEVWLWRQSNRLVAGREDLGGGRSGAIPRSPAPSSSGGTTCTARRPGR